MPTNIEIKLRCDDLADVRERALVADAKYAGALFQTDTFFRVDTGRLKLRELKGKHAELIAYAREDVAATKTSDYLIATVDEPLALLAVLARSCGVVGVVKKRRDLLLWRNVRIHLDRVEGLGNFVELESVVGEADETIARENLEQLIDLLALRDAQAVDVAYIDLLMRC